MNNGAEDGDIGNLAIARREQRRERRRSPDASIQTAQCVLLDQIGHALVLVSRTGQLLYANARLRTLAAQSESPIRLYRGRLSVSRVAVDTWIHQLGESDQGHRHAVLSTPKRTNALANKTYHISVTRLGLRRASDPIAIRIYEPYEDRQISADVLRQLYRLTHAESDLTVGLFAGQTLTALANARLISIHTARSQLKRVFRKCRVNSQAQLTRLLACGPTVL